MGIQKGSFFKNPFIGLYIEASDSLALLPKNAPHDVEAQLHSVLQVKVVRTFVDESGLLGLFAVMNSSGCILPGFAEESELKMLRKEGLNVYRIKKGHSPGNNILANDRGALVNPAVNPADARGISDCLGVEVFQQPVTNFGAIGSLNVITNKGLLAYNDISEVELKLMERIFKVKGAIGTVNFGSIANALGVVANSKGALVGETTSGFEMQRIYEGLFG